MIRLRRKGAKRLPPPPVHEDDIDRAARQIAMELSLRCTSIFATIAVREMLHEMTAALAARRFHVGQD